MNASWLSGDGLPAQADPVLPLPRVLAVLRREAEALQGLPLAALLGLDPLTLQTLGDAPPLAVLRKTLQCWLGQLERDLAAHLPPDGDVLRRSLDRLLATRAALAELLGLLPAEPVPAAADAAALAPPSVPPSRVAGGGWPLGAAAARAQGVSR